MEVIASKSFANGVVYACRTVDGYPIEVTDTFLPFYTKNAIGAKQNNLCTTDLGNRTERWMIGVSTMSGCPVGCKFCATSKLKKFRKLSAEEIVEQVEFVIQKNTDFKFIEAKEHKINYTRMGEPCLNIAAVKEAIQEINRRYPGTHHYVSTIGITGVDLSWVKGNITLQVSLHSLDENRRNNLIPYKKKMSIEELGRIRTSSHLKTTVNMTMVDRSDFDINKLRENFDPEYFFIKISPINPNAVSEENGLGAGIVTGQNLI